MMKLNQDCVRDVLMQVEETWEIKKDENGRPQMGTMDIDDLCKNLPKHSEEDILYSLINLEQAGYLELTTVWADGEILLRCRIDRMTYAGHEFLEKVRDSKRWAVVKKGLESLRDYSLSTISAVAEGVANAAINKLIGEIKL